MKKYISIIFVTLMAILSCQKEPQVINVSSVSLNMSTLSMTETETAALVATILPENADNQKIIWTTSDASVATINGGTVTAVGAGTATIIVTTDDGGKTAVCNVTVSKRIYPVTEITLDVNDITITEGESDYIIATVKPSNATNKNLIWTSSNTSVATVKDGKITAVKQGNAIITVKAEDGNITATCNVTVKGRPAPVTGVSLDKTSITLTEGDSEKLTATINPSNASNKTIFWTSSNNEIATVQDGIVTALKPGSATITVRTEDGNNTATCSVTVNAKVYHATAIYLNAESLTMLEGDTETLTAIVLPENAVNKTVTWSSNNPSIATVSSTGVVNAIKNGTATITATAQDGGYTASCIVTVTDITSFISAGFSSVTVGSGYVNYGSSYVYISAGVTLGLSISNHSKKDIHISKMKLSCSQTTLTTIYNLDEDLEGGYRITWNVTLGIAHYSPTVEFTYEYNGEEYSIRRTFNGTIGVNSVSPDNTSNLKTKHLSLPEESRRIEE